MAQTNACIWMSNANFEARSNKPALMNGGCTFNEERPHEALAMKRHAELYQPSARKFEGTPQDLTYPKMETRRVKATGHINDGKHSLFIATALAACSVGLQAGGQGDVKVQFGQLLLGQYG